MDDEFIEKWRKEMDATPFDAEQERNFLTRFIVAITDRHIKGIESAVRWLEFYGPDHWWAEADLMDEITRAVKGEE